jgi:predicted kinase
LWVFCGLPATGKSVLAAELSKALALVLFQSDRIRKEGKDHDPLQGEIVPFGEGLYRSTKRQRIYAQMFALAQEELKKGRSVILDATFSRAKWREEARQLATDLDTNIIFVECHSRVQTIRERLIQREQQLTISDARIEHLTDMVKAFEPLREIPNGIHIRLDTEQSRTGSFLELLTAGYACKCAQVKEVCTRINSTPC